MFLEILQLNMWQYPFTSDAFNVSVYQAPNAKIYSKWWKVTGVEGNNHGLFSSATLVFVWRAGQKNTETH